MARTSNLTVSLSKAYTSAVSVAYALQAVTADAGEFTAASGTLTFTAGQTTKTVPVTVSDEAVEGGTFRLVLSNPVNCTVDNSGGLVTIGVGATGYHAIFNQVYAAVHDPDHGYFGPQTGTRARSVPRHICALDSNIINEAPDHGGQTVSETVSYWPGLEAWHGLLNEDWTGYNRAWNAIDTYYVPGGANQPIVDYDAASPASYVAEQLLPSLYPPVTQVGAAVGVDPLYQELADTYGTTRMYLMHWIFDVEGLYGFHNGDGTTDIVAINTYERGMQESSFETIAHPCWNDWSNGGGPYGYEPLFTQGKPVYPAAPFDYGKKWSYTNAPDAEVRVIGWAAWAKKWATDQGNAALISASSAKASKMGDYARYNLFDKYFREIGNNTVGASFANEGSYKSCHYLINWYSAFGGEIPATGATEGSWGYRIGCSECHQGYQGINAAYALATGQGNLVPAAPSTGGDIWVGSVYRQAELNRWLQSPEGPIAGGVSNSLDASYQPATGGRQNATFYGMHYVYSPVWHDPQSNNWVGFQAWGQGRTADLFLAISEKAVASRTAMDTELLANLQTILDRLVNWFVESSFYLATATEDNGAGWNVPSTLSWVSETAVAGETLTAPNHEGLYEYLPTMTWPDDANDPDYATFWNANSVPNPTLHCQIKVWGQDLGVSASFAYLIIAYARAKQNLGKFTAPMITGGTKTPEDALDLAQNLIDWMWTNYWDGVGICIPEVRADYNRLADPVYVPTVFTGTMPNNDVIQNGDTFIDTRSFLRDDPMWSDVQAYIDGTGPAPVFTYHRFWAQCEYATACGAMHHWFPDRTSGGSGVPAA